MFWQGSGGRVARCCKEPSAGRKLSFESLESRTLLSAAGLLEGFNGVNVSQTPLMLSPPDSDGAVGPNSFLEAVNQSIAIYSKTTGGDAAGRQHHALGHLLWFAG